MKQHWLDQFMQHVRDIDDGVGDATDVVTDYRWVRSVAERRGVAGVARGIEQQLVAIEADVERLQDAVSSSGAARCVLLCMSAMNEKDVSGLVDIAHVSRYRT
jgi:septation ring formation regulator EzrA